MAAMSGTAGWLLTDTGVPLLPMARQQTMLQWTGGGDIPRPQGVMLALEAYFPNFPELRHEVLGMIFDGYAIVDSELIQAEIFWSGYYAAKSRQEGVESLERELRDLRDNVSRTWSL